MSCQTCADLRASWSPIDNGEAPPRCPEHSAAFADRVLCASWSPIDLRTWAFTLSDGRGEIIRINYDGTARINPEVSLDEASKLFWRAVQQAAIDHARTRREAAAFRAMEKYGITVGSWDGKNWRASSRLLHGATPDQYPSELEAVEAMAEICEQKALRGRSATDSALADWPTADVLQIDSDPREGQVEGQSGITKMGSGSSPDASITLLPCPFCGSKELTLQNLTDDDAFFVSCTGCNVQQIANYTASEAVNRWNRRAGWGTETDTQMWEWLESRNSLSMDIDFVEEDADDGSLSPDIGLDVDDEYWKLEWVQDRHCYESAGKTIRDAVREGMRMTANHPEAEVRS